MVVRAEALRSHWVAIALTAMLSGCTGDDWKPAFDEVASPDRFENVAIADADDALTFARVDDDGRSRLIAVTAYRDGIVRGIDLSIALGRPLGDPLQAYEALGYDGLRAALAAAPDAARAEIPAGRLTMPLDLGAHHIAAGTNFPEHAGEAGVEDGPFLFAKLVSPTGPYARVAAGEALLDYEVEVAWVTLAPLAPGKAPAAMGLILGNDFTDRATLLRHIDPWNVASGDGFTTGKSFPGYLPVGNLFVIPRDHRRFGAALELRLYVNGTLRQRAGAQEMIWDIDELVSQTWAAAERRWAHRDTQVSLLGDAAVIPPRTLLLSGTPHGTIFAGVHTRHYVGGLTAWLLGGWDQPLSSRVISAYIDDARRAGAFLRPGDRVEIHVDRLGVLRNAIIL